MRMRKKPHLVAAQLVYEALLRPGSGHEITPAIRPASLFLTGGGAGGLGHLVRPDEHAARQDVLARHPLAVVHQLPRVQARIDACGDKPRSYRTPKQPSNRRPGTDALPRKCVRSGGRGQRTRYAV